MKYIIAISIVTGSLTFSCKEDQSEPNEIRKMEENMRQNMEIKNDSLKKTDPETDHTNHQKSHKHDHAH